MVIMRKQSEALFKAEVDLESFKGAKTIAQLASGFGVHANGKILGC